MRFTDDIDNEAGWNALEAENARLRKALETLAEWDMLTPGACADGAWAKRLIEDALGTERQPNEAS